ncbi:MAG TPA: polymer-forming cytoskeletal protein [Spirochaetota bacterium]|nr:polymer-forming cytoskeletal protein [Spirochaetota bacterium]
MGTKKLYKITESEITTVLNEDFYLKGSIQFKSSLMIKGKFEGDITAPGLLVVAERAAVKGNIKCGLLISAGSIEGNINVQKKTIFKSGSFFKGDIFTAALITEDTAVFNGRCTMTSADSQRDQSQSLPVNEKK